MLRLSHHERAISRLSRRKLLAAGIGAGGLSLPSLLQLKATAAPQSVPNHKAKACIILYCWGGISHFESWDPKPDAPVEVRGEFAPIATATPGIFVSEHLPLL